MRRLWQARNVSLTTAVVRAARWGLVALAAFSTCYVARTAFGPRLEASVLAAGTAIGSAFLVAPADAVVDWDALEREVAASEPSNASPDALPTNPTGPNAKDRGASNAPDRKLEPRVKSTKGVYVSADQVERLSRVTKVPASRFVEPKGERPAGLQVAGVSGLGIGVRDGDVLTRVAGANVKSSAAVISTVLQLRAKRVAAISGEFWRGQERFQIVFQMPYLSPETAPSGSAAKLGRATRHLICAGGFQRGQQLNELG